MMTTVHTTVRLEEAAAEVTQLFEHTFVAVADLRGSLEDVFSAGPVDAERANQVVYPWAKALLDRGTVLGCGYVAAPDALSDRTLYLAWWQGESQQLLGHAEAPAGDPLDYTRREWFRMPEETGNRHITGPYVDYVCTDEYVVTCTVPVLSGGKMVGVAGADTLVETLENLLLDPLRSAGATLVSEHGRVIVSADHRLAPGALVALDQQPESVACGQLPLAVVRL